MSILPPLLALAALAASPAAAVDRADAPPRAYTVRYDASRDVYCIRFFSDALAADPHPGRSAITCQSRERWADEQVFIHHAGRPALAAR
ncbi:hypothetical protein [Sphingomonas sp. S6]|jgi:hypothetical protein|uniref:hypothetical protein n=1 Tax=Sphingomonas sp. S6 TaxID=3368600 RepID=UPI0028EF84F0|nr:hypothetical protein [uncultured Sphingomonas sp.]